MDGSFYALISRMKHIDRWALMRNSDRENVQEHSHMVAVIAHALAVIRNEVFSIPVDSGKVVIAALYHDATEILTGDMPTPVKYHNSAITTAYKQLESAAADKLLLTLPEQLRGSYVPALQPDDPEIEAIVKAADKLSAYIKCIEELKTGNSEFRSAAEQTRDKLTALGRPEVDYFMAHFLPAFELTLDELDLSVEKE